MTGKKAAKMLGQIYRGYIYKTLIKEAVKFAKTHAEDIDWNFDKKAVLAKVGLQPKAPAKSFFGGFSLLVLGGAIGAVAGVLLAPKPGAETLATVKDRAMSYLGNEQGMAEPARA